MGYQNNLRAASTLVATVLCLLCGHADARVGGAPISACVSMTPPHGSANADLPYELDIGVITTYSSGTSVRGMPLPLCHMNITGILIVCSSVCLATIIKHTKAHVTGSLWGRRIHYWPMDSPHKGLLKWKASRCHYIIMGDQTFTEHR